jgi:bifunctional non-homologous end joining protein LigD
MPLTWQQVRRGLTPQRYTLRTAPGLLERGLAWQDYAEGARSLRAAIEKFTSGSAAGAARARAAAPRRRGRAAVHYG